MELYYSFLLQLFISGSYCEESGELATDFLEFVADPRSNGTIVLAFGTVLNWQKAPKEKLDAFVDAMNSLKQYRIIWAYNGPKKNVAKHIFMTKWIPQRELLSHPKTVLFITHGGLKRLQSKCYFPPNVKY